jgi:AraC-like DNA-binding protein
MFIIDILPDKNLQHLIRKYQVIRWQFPNTVTPPAKYLAPRPEHSLTFYLRDKQAFKFIDSNSIDVYPNVILSGIHHSTLLRECGNDFWAYKIIFQPSALHLLTNLPAKILTNNYIDAEAVLGKEITDLYKRINSLNQVEEVTVHIEQYLKKWITKTKKETHALDYVVTDMVKNTTYYPLDLLAKKSYLSPRQLIRKFEERVGLSPKLFDKIIRFDSAYRLKNSKPNLDWLCIAIQTGYYDYQHLSKDYKLFTKCTPQEYFTIDTKAPERHFGLHF